MPKFLADENISPALVKFLRDNGLDVKDVREAGMSGASDSAVMALALAEERALVTFDKHFANILLYPLDSHFGVVRIRIDPPLLSDIAQAFARFFQKFDLTTIHQTLIILERDGFRVRRHG